MSSPYWILKIDQVVAEYMAKGLKPKRILFFIQQEHPELEVTKVWTIYRSIYRIQGSTGNTNVNSAKPCKRDSIQK